MRIRSSGSIVTLAIAVAALSAAISLSFTQTSAQAPEPSSTASKESPLKTSPLKTAWGEPDLQGIWTDEFDTPFQRPARYGTQEFLTQAQREEMDKQRTAHFGDDPRHDRLLDLPCSLAVIHSDRVCCDLQQRRRIDE